MCEWIKRITPTGLPLHSNRYPYFGNPGGVGCSDKRLSARSQNSRLRTGKPRVNRSAIRSTSAEPISRHRRLNSRDDIGLTPLEKLSGDLSTKLCHILLVDIRKMEAKTCRWSPQY